MFSVLAAVLLSGCSAADTIGMGGDLDLDWILPAANAPDSAIEDDRSATIVQWEADYRRVPMDIRRTVKELSWGLVTLIPKSFDAAMPPRVYARILLPNERIAVVNVAQADSQMIRVTVRVGVGGDAATEQVFLNQFKTTLMGKAAPDRGGKFKLPD